jgi:small subunit ribosomal protein S20
MPITKSAKKALTQSLKKHSRNEHFKNLYRETRKMFEKAISAKNLEDAQAVATKLQSNIDKLVKKNIIHKNNGSRKKSKFAVMLKGLETSLKA